MHPTARATTPTLNAQVLFGHTHYPDARIEVRPLVVDGVEYLTNRLLVIRRDFLHGLEGGWMRLGSEVTHGLQYLADALKDTPMRHPAGPSVRPSHGLRLAAVRRPASPSSGRSMPSTCTP